MELTERCDICRCDECRGNGHVKGLFHQMICDRCDGIGYLDPAGHWLDTTLAILVERYRLEQEAAGQQKAANTVPVWAWLRGYRSVDGLREGKKG